VLAEAPDHVTARRFHGIALFKLGRQDEGIADLASGGAGGHEPARLGGPGRGAARRRPRRGGGPGLHRGIAAQSAQIAAPPLAEQAFCTELGRHDFKVVDYPYRAEIRYGAGRPATRNCWT